MWLDSWLERGRALTERIPHSLVALVDRTYPRGRRRLCDHHPTLRELAGARSSKAGARILVLKDRPPGPRPRSANPSPFRTER